MRTACRLFSRGVIFTRARVLLALLSLRKNGGLLVVYPFYNVRLIEVSFKRGSTILSTVLFDADPSLSRQGLF